MASARRRRNRIESLVDNGIKVSGKDEVTRVILDFYTSLYPSEGIMRPLSKDLEFSGLSMAQRVALERPFEEDVEKGVFSISKDKAPGPDGIGATFIALIPKVSGAFKISEYRPISLMGCLYKVLAKVLADRLKMVLPFIISDCQSAFVANRQILDCSLVVNEAIDFYLRNGMGGMEFDISEIWHLLDFSILYSGVDASLDLCAMEERQSIVKFVSSYNMVGDMEREKLSCL
ncbi:uncharacterized protein LOC143891358 [Tasmannia lanceolata]|uniref:uncharacterized protein LOC143891358 n=1 Tax=Tasmannia lanceolata TaxID=3420 RepID=UPI004064B647